MALGVGDIMDAVVSHAQASGWFEQVTAHEPKNAPGKGVSCAVYFRRARCVRTRSGLDVTSACVEFTARIYTDMLMEPQDDIDPTAVSAMDALMGAYIGDFTLGELIAAVDVFGAHGGALQADAGYIPIDGRVYRSIDVNLPLLVDDLWEQIP